MAKNLSRKISLLLVFVILAACNPLKPSPDVIVTRMMAELDGRLVMDGECLRVDSDYGGSVLLLWPPDYSVKIQGDTVQVTEGLIAGTRVEYDLHIGDQVHFAGGAAPYPIDSTFFQVSPTSCPGPYWIYGGLNENEPKNKPLPQQNRPTPTQAGTVGDASPRPGIPATQPPVSTAIPSKTANELQPIVQTETQTPVPTTAPPIVTGKIVASDTVANVRSGPGTTYDRIGHCQAEL